MGFLERFGVFVERVRAWFRSSVKIGSILLKGAYLVTERRRLFRKLGEEVYFKIQKGEWRNAELEGAVRELEKLSRKVEIEEVRIRKLRYGKLET